MPNERMRERQTTQQVEPDGAMPGAGEPSPLLQQSQGFANVAREANEKCARGEDANTDLYLRRNGSGQ